MKSRIAREEIESLGRRLRHAREARLLSDQEFKQLHARFVAYDGTGGVWSVGLGSGKWNRLEDGSWVSREPPGALDIEQSLITEIQALNVSDEPEKSGGRVGAHDQPRQTQTFTTRSRPTQLSGQRALAWAILAAVVGFSVSGYFWLGQHGFDLAKLLNRATQSPVDTPKRRPRVTTSEEIRNPGPGKTKPVRSSKRIDPPSAQPEEEYSDFITLEGGNRK